MLNFILVHSMIYLFILCSNIFVKAIFKRCLESHCYLIHPLPFVMSVDRINRIALYTTHSGRRDFLPFLDYVYTVTFPNISNMLFPILYAPHANVCLDKNSISHGSLSPFIFHQIDRVITCQRVS